MTKKNKIVLVIMLMVGLVIFYFSVKQISYHSLMDAIAHLHWSWLVVAFLLMVSSLLLEARVVQVLIRQQLPTYSFWAALRVPLVEQLFNGITPFATGGQPAQLVALLQSGVDAGRATSSLLMKFIVYQAMIVVNFIICLALGFQYVADRIHGMIWLLVFGFIIHFAVIVSLLMIMFWYRLTKKLLKLMMLVLKKVMTNSNRYKQLEQTLNEKVDSFYQESLKLKANKQVLVRISCLTLFQLLIYYVIPYFILLALGVTNANILLVTTLHVLIVMVISLFPIPGGAGGAEYSFSVVFSTFVQQGNRLVVAMFLWRIITYYLGMFSGIIALAFEPKKTSK